MLKTAWVFPGQGSQMAGMGCDLLDFPIAKQRFDVAQKILGWSVFEACQDRQGELNKTLYVQPCLYVVSAILADLVKDRGLEPNLVAGHSLGEYAALYSAGVFSFEVGLQLVKSRAELMDNASEGEMVALIGFDRQELEAQIWQIPDVVLANDNHGSQVVISGTSAGIQTAIERIKIRRSVPLKVSGAFHSPLMAKAAAEFDRILASVPFENARIPVISNVNPEPAIEAEILKERLQQQMTSLVRWREIVLKLATEDVKKVLEIGPDRILTKLIDRICPDLEVENVSSAEELNETIRLETCQSC
jgi:[acyl-carrier-protein] S-malonyltransferase